MTTEKHSPLVEHVDPPDVVRLYTLLVGTGALDEFLRGLADVAAHNVDRRLSCGITVEVKGEVISFASSDEFAAALDEFQRHTGTGPCLAARHEQRIVEFAGGAELDAWPDWRDHALANGLKRMLAVPLWGTGDTGGALNLYSRSEVDFTDADRQAALSFAAQAGGAVAVAARLARQADLVSHLEAALTSRAVIDQAKGVLMARHSCSSEEAFDLLSKVSQDHNVKLRVLAEQIVARYDRRRATGVRR